MLCEGERSRTSQQTRLKPETIRIRVGKQDSCQLGRDAGRRTIGVFFAGFQRLGLNRVKKYGIGCGAWASEWSLAIAL